MTTSTLIPVPAGAVEAGEWQVSGDEITRVFRGTARETGRWYVGIAGRQDHSGEVLTREALVVVEAPFDAAGLRELAAGVLAAADELDEFA
jgi:hypothetical protein